MADDIVIRAEGLGKKYTIGHQSERERYTALRDVMARGARNLWRKTADLARGRAVVAGDRVEEFWALKDVSFEVRRGEVLGIIGRNGAGKSTLLKILSRITEPSEGRVTIKGRVASLLEVGTGFHPELTGRENIYLNGAILGMTRAEIRRKFDEIVDFAGVEKFLDTPVKRYSSGMYVRLAFAVAAHLEPEILVIDEVLAVGDAEFQKKCLGKMGEVAQGGRTVLFVSHNMSAIEALCPRSIRLSDGAIAADGESNEVIHSYLKDRSNSSQPGPNSIKVDENLILERIEITPLIVTSGGCCKIEAWFRSNGPSRILECAILIYSLKGARIAIVDMRESGVLPLQCINERFCMIAEITKIPFVEGEFTAGIYLVTELFNGNLMDIAHFSVVEWWRSQTGAVPYNSDSRGIVILDATTCVTFECEEG